MTNVTFLEASLGPNKSTFGGGHTHFSVEIGLNEGFRGYDTKELTTPRHPRHRKKVLKHASSGLETISNGKSTIENLCVDINIVQFGH